MRNRLSQSSITPLNPPFPVLLSPKSDPTTSLSQDIAFLRSDQLWPIKYVPPIIGPGPFFGDSRDLWRHHGEGIGLPPSSSSF